MTIRLGVAGVSHPHINAILAEATSRSDIELMGIAERDPVLRETYTARYSVPGFTDLEQLLGAGPPEAIAVADVFGHRGAVVAMALRARCHVLSDKPLCTTREDLDAIHDAWLRGGRLLSVAFDKRFYAPTVRAEELIAAGGLGEIALITATGPHKLLREQRPDWMFKASTYGGILNDLVVHDIDLFLRFTGAVQGCVTGYTGNYANAETPEFEDCGLAVVDVASGPTASLDAHWFTPEAAPYHGDYKMRVVGSSGTADLLWKDGELIVGTHQRPPEPVPLPPQIRPAQDFFDALVNGVEPKVSAVDALAATSIALAAQESARTRQPVNWDISRFVHVNGGGRPAA